MNRADSKWAQRFISSLDWRFAKTMLQWPHWYIVRREGNRCTDFDRLATLVKTFGEDDKWGTQTRRYLRIGRYKYWVMGEIINRAAPIPSSEVRRRGEQWLHAHRTKVGPYGNVIPIRKSPQRKERIVGRRVYGDLRDIIERRGGSMKWQQAGYRHGAWILSLGAKTAIVEASGNRSFPEFDRLYETTHPHPMHWDDYDGPLVKDAEEKLLSLLR